MWFNVIFHTATLTPNEISNRIRDYIAHFHWIDKYFELEFTNSKMPKRNVGICH